MDSSINLDTALGHHIDNAQLFEISSFEKSQFENLIKQYGAWVKFRSNPTPQYNCHGLTFASRRTGIYDADELGKILKEDGYIELKTDKVLPGDIIIYFSEDGDYEHSGIVITSPDENSLNVPMVVSKWGKFAEVIHPANNCPYSFFNVKYYRIYPNELT